MKRLLAMGMSTILALPILSTAVMYAEDTTQTNTTNTTQPETTDEIKSLADRIAKHKLEFKTKLTNVEKLRVQSKCKASQGLVSSLTGRIKGIETSRGQVYKNIITHLTSLSEKLKNKGVDTTTLNDDIAVLQDKMDTFSTDLAAYKLAVSDLNIMDCKADPDGFKASLEAARAARQKVNEDGKAVRGYITDTIKPLLKTIRAELETDKTEGSQ
jgi:hypothetical protein